MKILTSSLVLAFCFNLGIGFAQSATETNSRNSRLQGATVDSIVLSIRKQPTSIEQFREKESAIKEVGESHSTNPPVIEALLDNISYTTRETGASLINPMNAPKYSISPAYDALRTIGEPCIPFVMERIKKTEADELRAKYIMLLNRIAGKQSATILRDALADVSKERNRLEKALEAIPALQP